MVDWLADIKILPFGSYFLCPFSVLKLLERIDSHTIAKKHNSYNEKDDYFQSCFNPIFHVVHSAPYRA
jgi:hypothetical protein